MDYECLLNTSFKVSRKCQCYSNPWQFHCPRHETVFLPTCIGLKLLPPKFTSLHQTADMGIIVSLKVGYKALYLWKILENFDTPVGFESVAVARRQQRRGCRGIEHGDKPHLLYCMMMLLQVWNGDDGNYVSDESARRCRRKADILSVTWNSDINNNFGSVTLAHTKLSAMIFVMSYAS